MIEIKVKLELDNRIYRIELISVDMTVWFSVAQ